MAHSQRRTTTVSLWWARLGGSACFVLACGGCVGSDDGKDAAAGDSSQGGDTTSTLPGERGTEPGVGGDAAGGAATAGGRTGLGEGGARASGGRDGAGGASAAGPGPATGGTVAAGGVEQGSAATGGSAGLAEAGIAGNGGQAACGGATGAGEAGALSIGGSAGTGARDEIVLDPNTMVFFDPMYHVRSAAVVGYDPERRVCAALVWFDPGSDLILGATCASASEFPPGVALALDQDGPCMPEDLPSYSSLEPLSVEGCLDVSQMSGSGMDLVDAVAELESETFTGRIVADNRSSRDPRPVTFGLTYLTDTPVYVYVQSNAGDGYPGWASVTHDGEPVNIFGGCRPNCDGSNVRDCGSGEGAAAPIVNRDDQGSAYLTWDGYLYEYDVGNDCEIRTPASAGAYQVQMCFGYDANTTDSGDWVIDPTCVTQDFTLPTDLVVIDVDHGG
ncbi:MAG: hypothetical protein JW940_05760 [Polyangiaceae bacterium]|nr:hypothetical protein [Polyangiaceae bacterium]